MSAAAPQNLSRKDHEMAMTEVSFLMDIFASTIDDLMGGAIAPVGRIAGRNHGKKMPVYLPDPKLEEVIQVAARQMHRGFDFCGESCTSSGAVIRFRRCVIRKVCASRQLELGGTLCRLLHAYLDGVFNELTARPTKSIIESAGEECRICLEMQ